MPKAFRQMKHECPNVWNYSKKSTPKSGFYFYVSLAYGLIETWIILRSKFRASLNLSLKFYPVLQNLALGL